MSYGISCMILAEKDNLRILRRSKFIFSKMANKKEKSVKKV